jgi:hypothetical protein
MKASELLQAKFPRHGLGPDASVKEGFVGIDIADPSD